MNGVELNKDGWDCRKSLGGWSVDVKIGTSWIFVSKFKTKKEAIAYINRHLDDPKSKFV